MAVNERATTTIIINNQEAKAALEELQGELSKIKQLRKEAFEKGDTSAFEMYDRQFKKIGSEAARMKKEIHGVDATLKNLSGASLYDIENAFRSVQKQMKMVSRTDPRFNELKAQAKLLKVELSKVSNEFRQQQSWTSKLSDGFNKYFGIITAGAASLAGLIMAGRKAVDEFNKFDDQVADVMKTTGMTKDEVIELDKQLQKINTRSSQDELLALGRVAGKLGITGVENVEGFVRASDKINVALSEDLGGNTEEAINQIGKLTDIFKLKEEFGIEQSMLKVGSAINSLGAASTANEGYLVEFTKRMAGVAPSANMSISQVLGLGATLDQLGQTSEVSSTTVSAVLTDMFKSPGQYASIAKMSIDDFNNLLKTDSNEAFVRFLEGLNGNSQGLGEMANKLDGLGLEGKRSISVLGVLSNNTKILRDQQALANIEFDKGTSLTNEFNIKNETSQAKLEKAQKTMAIYRRELGEKLAPAMTHVVSGGTMIMKVLGALVNLFTKHGTEILLVAGAIAAYNIALQISTASTKANILWTNIATAANSAWATVTGIITGKIKIATIAQKAWNLAMKMNPIGALLAVVMALAAGVVFLVKKLNEQSAAQRIVNDVNKQAQKAVIDQKIKVEELLEVARDETRSLEERKRALESLNKISPKYFGNLTLETINSEMAKKATDDYINSLVEKARVQAAQEKLVELERKRLEDEIDGTDRKVKWYQKLGNSMAANGNVLVYARLNESSANKNASKAQKEYNEQVEALKGILKSGQKPDGTTIENTVTNTTEDVTKQVVDPVSNSNDIENKKKQAREKAFNDLEIANRKELNAIKQHQLEVNASEEEYNAILEAKELEYLNKKLGLQKKFGEDTTDTEAAILDKKLKAQEEADKKSQEQKKKEQDIAIKNLENQQAAEENLIKKNLQQGLIDEDEAEQQLLQKEIEFLNKRIALKKQYGEDTADLEGQVFDKTQKIAENAVKGHEEQEKALAELRKKYADDEVVRKQELADELAELDKVTKNGSLVTEEEYQKLKSAIHAKYEKNRYEITQKYLEGASKILGIVSDLNNAAKDAELAKAGDNAAKKEQIEKKFAKKSQNIAIAQAAVNGALAVTKILAETPKADFGIMTGILIAAAIATTIAEIAAIKKQQFRSGGYTSTSTSDSTPVGVVHANEWVASAPLLRNPETRRHIDYLESVQRGIAPRFNTEAIAQASRGFAAGGYTSATAPATVAANASGNAAMEQNNAMMGAMIGLLNSLQQNGIKATADINANEVFRSKQNYDEAISASEY